MWVGMEKGGVQFLTILFSKEKTDSIPFSNKLPLRKWDWFDTPCLKAEKKKSDKEEWSLNTRKRRTKRRLCSELLLFFNHIGIAISVSVVCCYCVWELLWHQISVFSNHFERVKWASSMQGLPSYCPIWKRRRKF